ncbi:MAG: hypothetical protein H6705_12445 [Myxococcales bacterium]|nr:hypothetical protein [Myxococcales bacterium]
MADEAATGEAEALRRIEAEREARTGWLDLSALGLRRLPPALFALTWLEGLNLGRFLRAPDGTPTKWAGDNHLTTLPPALARLTALRRLFIDGNPITDLGPVAGLSGLQMLDCSETGVADLGPVAGLAGLQMLDCSETGVADLGPVAGLSGLRTLDFSKTQVADLVPVAGLVELQSLICSRRRG